MTDKTAINGRFRQVAEHLLFSKTVINRSELAQIIGISSSRFSEIRNNKMNVSAEMIAKLCANYPEVNPIWILTGKGDMLKFTNQKTIEITKLHHPKVKDREIFDQNIPLYDIYAVAGVVPVFSDLAGEYTEDYISLPNAPKCDGACYIHGDSMYPLLKSGDIVMFKSISDLSYILYGEMYLLSIVHDGDEYVTIKYLQHSDRDDHIRLVSYNPHHHPVDFPLSSIVSLALVKASIRYNTMK